MKVSFVLPALLCLAILSGCANADKLNAIRIGMTESEVVSVLGKPDSKSAQGNIEYFTYYLYSNSSRYGDQPYLVRMVDGKVESFGRFLQLLDVYNRPVPGTPQEAMGYPLGYRITTSVPMGTGRADVASQLQRLQELKAQGALTEAEFQRAKARVLDQEK